MDIGNEETDLRIKNVLSWQNILNNRQIVADIEGKRANQGEVLRGGISRIYFSLSKLMETMPRNQKQSAT